MDTASGNGEPRPGWLLRQASIYGWHVNNEAVNLENAVPLRGFSPNISRSIANESTEEEELQPRLIPQLTDKELWNLCRRLAFVQSTLRKNDRAGERRSTARPPDEEFRQTSHTLPRKRHLIAKVQEALPEFDSFIGSQNLSINRDTLFNFSHSASLSDFLLRGPSIQGGVPEGLTWLDYSRAVKVLLSSPGSRNWLDEDFGTFLGVEQLTGVVESDVIAEEEQMRPREQFDEEAQTELNPERVRSSVGHWTLQNLLALASGSFVSSSFIPAPRSTQNPQRPRNILGRQQNDDPNHGSRPPRRLSRICTLLYTPLATTVCILNITAALGYVMLMNDPSLPQNSFIIGTLVTWFLTAAMMIVHGILTTGSMKDYARRLVILAMFTCFVVAVVFHFAGASNFASSFLVGITMAILLIQIW